MKVTFPLGRVCAFFGRDANPGERLRRLVLDLGNQNPVRIQTPTSRNLAQRSLEEQDGWQTAARTRQTWTV